jgi:tRNA A37 threonylcarbamoyladenosine dehydratase
MTDNIFHRTELLLGREAIGRLHETKVILFGVGGVGSWCAEGLVRSGIGSLDMVDFDTVCVSNINRQLHATPAAIGKVKVDAMKKRLLEINPRAKIGALHKVYSEEHSEEFRLHEYHYIIDAIDILENKIHLIKSALETEAVLFSSMGAALKRDPSRIKTGSIWKTSGCPLARRIRNGLRKMNISSDFQCVYSDEAVKKTGERSRQDNAAGKDDEFCIVPGSAETAEGRELAGKKRINGSLVHITGIFGFMLAGMVINSVAGGEVPGSGFRVPG